MRSGLPAEASAATLLRNSPFINGRAVIRLALCLMMLQGAYGISMSIIAVVRSDLQQQLLLSDAQIGLLTSAFMLTVGLASIPGGLAANRWGGRTLFGGVGVFILGCVLCALGSSYSFLVAGMLLQGLGLAPTMPVANHLFVQHVRPDQRAKALGIFSCGGGIGVIISLLLMSSIQAVGGYRAVFVVTAAIGVGLGLLIATQPSVRAGAGESVDRESALALFRGVASMARCSQLWLLVLINMGSMAALVGILAWTPGFLHDKAGFGLTAAAYLTAFVGLAKVVGALAGGAVMARWGKPLVLMTGIIVLLVATAIVPIVPGVTLAVCCVIVAGFMSVAMFPAVLGSVADVVDEKHVGSATGLLNLTNLVGTLLSPWMFGVLLDRFGTGIDQGGYLAGYLWLALFPFFGCFAAVVYIRRRRVLRGGRETLDTA